MTRIARARALGVLFLSAGDKIAVLDGEHFAGEDRQIANRAGAPALEFQLQVVCPGRQVRNLRAFVMVDAVHVARRDIVAAESYGYMNACLKALGAR